MHTCNRSKREGRVNLEVEEDGGTRGPSWKKISSAHPSVFGGGRLSLVEKKWGSMLSGAEFYNFHLSLRFSANCLIFFKEMLVWKINK